MYTISSLDFCAIAGLSPYDSPISLFLKKQGKIPREREETFQMKLGKKMEKLHRELLQERGIVAVTGEFNLRKHPKNEAFIAVPDGFCNYKDGMRVLENKTCLHGVIYEKFFETQLRWEMFVCQCDGLLTVLTPNDLYVMEYNRDPEWEREAERMATQFLDLLEKNELPSIENYHPATLEALKKVERPLEEAVELSCVYEHMFKKIEDLNEEIKRNEEAIELLKSQLLASIGEYKEARCGSYKMKVIKYDRKPSITISEVNDVIIETLDNLGTKYKLNEGGSVSRIDIRNINK